MTTGLTIKPRLLPFILLFPFFSAWGQVHEVESWIGTAVELELNKRFDLEIDQQVRLGSNLSRFNQYLINPELSYGRKGFSATLAYRFSVRNEGSPFVSFRHRAQLGASYRHRFGDFRLGSKVRYQQVFFPIRNSERIPYEDGRRTFRHKFDLKYEGEKEAQPFIALEYFLPLDQGIVSVGRIRYRAGVSVDLPKRMGMNFYYTLEQVFTEAQPTYNHILGIFWSIAPKLKKKKKKDK